MIEATVYFVHVNRLSDHRVLTYTHSIMLNYYYKAGSVLPWMESYGLFKVQSHVEYNLAGLQITLEFSRTAGISSKLPGMEFIWDGVVYMFDYYPDTYTTTNCIVSG